ncbi:hypothetical protein HBI56_120130 [Parastagonospora nodorum]|nr:hypothetical protein HBH52_029070 [Parastagonospora nodorum]KAH3993270.1 hypothetical protein HBI10_204390 [Parastagonospora nodorum]KAH4011097.1 hypothetical protein HBI13_200140 [Parastagonospora nodorum]KAH4107659.1 hypothetical protein HBH46_050250 [Parastagonospora nodorum]KAH4906046.1 hypothetical protein HBH74_176810 [Parastagonospora nodorum]
MTSVKTRKKKRKRQNNTEKKKGAEEKMDLRLILIQTVGSIKVAYNANKSPSSPNPDLLQLSAEDAEAFFAFRVLRKGSLPLDLMLEWKYGVHAHSSSNIPSFVSTVLQDWQDSFGRVTITTTISDDRDGPMGQVQEQGKQNDEDTQHPVQATPIISIRNRLRREAEQCARQLIRSNDCGMPRVQLSVGKQFAHWMEIRMYFQTVETVDSEMGRATPLAGLDERYQPDV